jgi:hypothetical protein
VATETGQRDKTRPVLLKIAAQLYWAVRASRPGRAAGGRANDLQAAGAPATHFAPGRSTRLKGELACRDLIERLQLHVLPNGSCKPVLRFCPQISVKYPAHRI